MTLVNALQVTEGSINFPSNGAWAMDCTCVVATAPTGQALDAPVVGSPCIVTLGPLTSPTLLKGVVLVSDTREFGRARLRITGGTLGGFGANAPALNFPGPSLPTVAGALLGTAGEVFNAGLSDPSMVAQRFTSWQSLSDRTLAQNMTLLAEVAGGSWRVDPTTGTTLFTVDRFLVPASMPTGAVVESVNSAGDVTFYCPELDALPLPGTTFSDPLNPLSPAIQVKDVWVWLDADRITVQLCKQQLSDLAQQKPAEAELRGLYACQVVNDNGDGTLNLNPDDSRIKGTGLAFVKVRLGPGVSVTVQPGTRCWICFDNGDPSKPSVVQFDGAAGSAQAPPFGVWTFGSAAATPVANNAVDLQAWFAEVSAWMSAVQAWAATLLVPAIPAGPVAPIPAPPGAAPVVVATQVKSE